MNPHSLQLTIWQAFMRAEGFDVTGLAMLYFSKWEGFCEPGIPRRRFDQRIS